MTKKAASKATATSDLAPVTAIGDPAAAIIQFQAVQRGGTPLDQVLANLSDRMPLVRLVVASKLKQYEAKKAETLKLRAGAAAAADKHAREFARLFEALAKCDDNEAAQACDLAKAAYLSRTPDTYRLIESHVAVIEAEPGADTYSAAATYKFRDDATGDTAALSLTRSAPLPAAISAVGLLVTSAGAEAAKHATSLAFLVSKINNRANLELEAECLVTMNALSQLEGGAELAAALDAKSAAAIDAELAAL